jgi:hypothetical protein
VPAREALGRTARWLADNPPAPGGQEEAVLTDPFDYAAEDRLIDAWQAVLAALPEVAFEREPRFGLAYRAPAEDARVDFDFSGATNGGAPRPGPKKAIGNNVPV